MFRRHVGGRSAAYVGALELAGQSRQAEIGDEHVASAVEHDVGRFQIAVQHALLVRRGQSGAEAARDVEGLIGGQATDAAQQRRQVLPIHVFHRDVMLALELADVVNAADVGMRNLARNADLVQKPLEQDTVGGQRRRQEFQRDRLAQLQIGSAVDLAHPAPADERDDAVAAGDKSAGQETLLVGRRRGVVGRRHQFGWAQIGVGRGRNGRPAMAAEAGRIGQFRVAHAAARHSSASLAGAALEYTHDPS